MQYSFLEYADKVKERTKYWESIVGFALVAFLATFPLLTKLLQNVFHVAIMDCDIAVVQFCFMLSCLAGFVTWHEKRHLSLASLSDKLPPLAKSITENIKVLLVSAILTALFFDSFCQLVNPAQFTARFWGMSTKFFFALLPACYLLIMAYNFVSIIKNAKQHTKKVSESSQHSNILLKMMPRESLVLLVSNILGFLLGLFLSSGTILGVLYYLFGTETCPLLDTLNNAWLLSSQVGALPFILLLLVAAFMGVPLFLILAAVAYILFSSPLMGGIDMIPLETNRILTDRNTCAIPLFTIAGYILSQSRAGTRYVALFKALFGSFRGGTVIASVIVVTLFSTFTGVSGVTILALGGLLSIALTGSGYDKGRAESLVTASGAIGLLFPPSAAIIMYATTNYFFGIDVFALFKAAVIPGVLMMAAMIILGVIFDTRKTRDPFSLQNLLSALLNALPELLMPLAMCIFYFGGLFDLFETACFAVLYSFIITIVPRHKYSISINRLNKKDPSNNKRVAFSAINDGRDYTFKKSIQVIFDSIPVFGGVIFILGAASGISMYIITGGVTDMVTQFIKQFVTNKYVFLLLMNIVLLFVGCLMDMFSAILIVSPLLLPLADAFGVNLIQSAVIFLMNLSIGFLTPPIGMDLFISSYTFNKPMGRVIKGIVPFLIVQFVVLMLVTYVPFFTSVIK